MKKIVCVLLLCGMLTAFFQGCGKTPTEPAGSSDSASEWVESPVEDFKYEENEDGGITITEYIGNDADVVIPGKIDGKDVTRIGERAFNTQLTIVLVKIPDTVTAIEQYAFQMSPRLTTICLSQNLKAIDDYAFQNCGVLSTITLPESLTKIGHCAFEKCESLKQITIPKNVAEWGACTFMGSGLETVEFEEGLESIGGDAFSKTNIKEIILPKSIKTIRPGAFSSCAHLESLILNEGLLTINSLILAYTNVKEIVIPASVKNITESAFNRCNALEKVKFEGNAPENFAVEPTELVDENGNTFLGSEIQGNYTVCYHEGAEGFTSPTWNDYTTEIW